MYNIFNYSKRLFHYGKWAFKFLVVKFTSFLLFMSYETLKIYVYEFLYFVQKFKFTRTKF